jgi:mannosyltransferase PIG-M
VDHRHNFSLYNTLLHINSSPPFQSTGQLERLAFIPQIFLSAIAIPFALAKKDLAGAMMCQTIAFVAFNKVCTSQVCVALSNMRNDLTTNSIFYGILFSCQSIFQIHA